MKSGTPGALFIIALAMTGCVGRGIIWTGHHSFHSTDWEVDEPVKFTPDSASLQKGIDKEKVGLLSIRYSPKASVERLPLLVETESPSDGLFAADTIYIDLLPVMERTANRCRMGIFEVTDTLSLRGQVSDGWNICFTQVSGSEIDGIISLTFQIDEK